MINDLEAVVKVLNFVIKELMFIYVLIVSVVC